MIKASIDQHIIQRHLDRAERFWQDFVWSFSLYTRDIIQLHYYNVIKNKTKDIIRL